MTETINRDAWAEVLSLCESEAQVNREAGDAHTPADIAADIAQRLYAVYRVVPYDDGKPGPLAKAEAQEFLIAFELNEDYEGELAAYLEDPASWGNLVFDWLDYAEWHLMCPHCGAEDQIVEVDDAQRWNKLLTEDVDFSGGKMFVKADMGEHGDYEFLKFQCAACLNEVDAPVVFEIEEYV
jgi:hypothetical protein